MASTAQKWFRRLRRTDDLSRLVKAADISAHLDRADINAVRKLLEEEETWRQLGGRDVTELCSRIAACLPPRDGRTAEDSSNAAEVIARGLIEFAVFELEPGTFQKVVLARLQQMTGQASALDNALYEVHCDLYARIDDATDLLKRVADRLPPGPAGYAEIAIYLKTLVGWLGTDPWPRDRRFGGPVLSPAAVERKLRLAAPATGEHDLDADTLTAQCERLVILGGPGSGKTWLAKRTARHCAEKALDELATGGTLDEVELPLYTTCAHLFSADGDIRNAVVSSALKQIGDLGGSSVSAALQRFFAERNASTVLVIDSLDEALGRDERLRQADTLPWRIVLTSRPTSWNHQLTIEPANSGHQVGNLQPLRYPGDVESFIAQWFAPNPESGTRLAAQIAGRPDLQQSATVPLILAFCCIVGGGLLPDFRHDLYPKVLRRMLTGRWRGIDGSRPNVETCLRTLRALAWSGATSHPVSGVGTWTDDLASEDNILEEADESALNNIASPLGPADIDTGKILRRFVHRSIREYLVAEHIAGLPVDQAVEALISHLWFDPDWKYSAVGAITMHPHHDQLLRGLICRAASTDQIPADLSGIDVGLEWRLLFAQLASESRETDWLPDLAEMIGQARLDLVRAGRAGDVARAAFWWTSNRQACDELLTALGRENNCWDAIKLTAGLAKFDPTTEERRCACAALLDLITSKGDGVPREELAGSLVRLIPTPDDKREARNALVRLLATQTNSLEAAGLASAILQLDPTTEDKRQALTSLLGLLADAVGYLRWELAGCAVQFVGTERDRHQVRDLLFGWMAEETLKLGDLVGWAHHLATTEEDNTQVRDILLGLLAGKIDRWQVGGLVDWVIRLAITDEDKNQARDTMLEVLQAGRTGAVAARLAKGVAELHPTTDDMRQARDVLLDLLADETDDGSIQTLVDGVVQLVATEDDKRQIRDALLTLLLASQRHKGKAAPLAGGIARLDPTEQEMRLAREAIIPDVFYEPQLMASDWVGPLIQLAPTQAEIRRAREAIVRHASYDEGISVDDWVGCLVRLNPTAEDRQLARGTLLGWLARFQDGRVAPRMIGGITQLVRTATEKQQACDALLGLLARETDGGMALGLAGGVVQLASTVADKQHARDVLLRMLTSQTHSKVASHLAMAIAQLDPTADQKRHARHTLLRLLASQGDKSIVSQLEMAIAQLDPTIEDITGTRTVSAQLLAAVRRNSALNDWLRALPTLGSLSH